MRLLVAAAGPRAEDFAFTVPGELVRLAVACDRDRSGDGECGCGRSFAGLSSGMATTVAVVAEVDVTREDLVAMLRSQPEWIADLAEDWADEMIRDAEAFDVGTYVRRRLWFDEDGEPVDEIEAT